MNEQEKQDGIAALKNIQKRIDLLKMGLVLAEITEQSGDAGKLSAYDMLKSGFASALDVAETLLEIIIEATKD